MSIEIKFQPLPIAPELEEGSNMTMATRWRLAMGVKVKDESERWECGQQSTPAPQVPQLCIVHPPVSLIQLRVVESVQHGPGCPLGTSGPAEGTFGNIVSGSCGEEVRLSM